jgi:glutamyl-tRNA reductase
MSPISRALHERFEEVCPRELERLRRKTASLPPEARSEVDAITRAVTQAIAARVGAVLDREPGGELDLIVARLFAVTVLSDVSPE